MGDFGTTRRGAQSQPSQLVHSACSQLLCGASVLSIGGSNVFAGAAGTQILVIRSGSGRVTAHAAQVLDSELYPAARPVVACSPSGERVGHAVKSGSLGFGGSGGEPAGSPTLEVMSPEGGHRWP